MPNNYVVAKKWETRISRYTSAPQEIMLEEVWCGWKKLVTPSLGNYSNNCFECYALSVYYQYPIQCQALMFHNVSVLSSLLSSLLPLSLAFLLFLSLFLSLSPLQKYTKTGIKIAWGRVKSGHHYYIKTYLLLETRSMWLWLWNFFSSKICLQRNNLARAFSCAW